MNALHMLPEPIYAASNYTHHPRGLVGAYLEMCELVPRIYAKYKIVLFSPVIHGHGLAMHGKFPPRDGKFWKRYNQPFVDLMQSCLVAKLDGWENSAGIKDEIDDFRAAKKTVLFVEPVSLEIGLT